jgi:hypothetical protein
VVLTAIEHGAKSSHTSGRWLIRRLIRDNNHQSCSVVGDANEENSDIVTAVE